MNATYSPEDNKLRLYCETRLDRETYDRIRAAGFRWAPKQDLFFAPAWTPDREDILRELAGEIGDEDKSLVERAEERADRFDDYSDNRAKDADSARAAVSAIADKIPFGQPILVGHHSEKRARRDAAKIENGMRRAVKMWECSQYWKDRAAGALRHAKYLERPDVRARRIKKLESEKRGQERTKARAEKFARAWSKPDLTQEQAEGIANYDGSYWKFKFEFKRETGETYHVGPCSLWDALNRQGIPLEEVRQKALRNHAGTIARAERWLSHFENRLTYERAMLEADGGTVADRTGPEKGGGCRCWASHRGGWSYIQKVNKVSVTVLDNWGNERDQDGSRNFTRNIPFDKLHAVMTVGEVEAARREGRLVDYPDKTGFILRAKTTDDEPTDDEPKPEPPTNAADFDAMKKTLAAGVQVVAANQLFPTPPDLARRLVELAEIRDGDRVLEPSAGTGAIAAEIPAGAGLVCVEINQTLAQRLTDKGYHVANVDFLTTRAGLPTAGESYAQSTRVLGEFDRILMNPPFQNADDIKHIEHARTFLRPGGKLVAICANGPRQNEKLQPLADSWEVLPAGTFNGTGVHAVLLTISGPPANTQQPELF